MTKRWTLEKMRAPRAELTTPSEARAMLADTSEKRTCPDCGTGDDRDHAHSCTAPVRPTPELSYSESMGWICRTCGTDDCEHTAAAYERGAK